MSAALSRARARRPHLTLNDSLLGIGAFPAGPTVDTDYRRGYLCGVIRGDAHLGSYSYPRPGRTSGDRPPVPPGASRPGGAGTCQRIPGVVRCRDERVCVRELRFAADAGHPDPGPVLGRAGAGDRRVARASDAFLAKRIPGRHLRRGGLMRRVAPDPEHRRRDHRAHRRVLARARVPLRHRGSTARERTPLRPAPGRNIRATAVLLDGRPCHHAQAVDRGARGEDVRAARGRVDRAARPRAADVRHHDGNRRLRRQRRDQPQLLRAADARVPGHGRGVGTSSARSWSRSTCPRSCGRSWGASRGGATASPWARTRTRTSGWRVATSSCAAIWEAMRDFRNPCSILTKSPLVLRDLDLLQEIAAVTEVSACLSVPTWTRRRGGRPSRTRRTRRRGWRRWRSSTAPASRPGS